MANFSCDDPKFVVREWIIQQRIWIRPILNKAGEGGINKTIQQRGQQQAEDLVIFEHTACLTQNGSLFCCFVSMQSAMPDCFHAL